jgi:hypothetical protein
VKKNSRTESQSLGGLGLILLLQAALASGAIANEKSATPEVSQDWKPTTLSEKTLGKINQAVESYHRCLNDETTKHVNDPEDSRKLTDLILSVCDPKLGPIKPAFHAEKVPDVISERYLQRKRSQAAQQVVRVVMGAHALRYRESHPE